jgi:hypothetical protein
MNTIDDNIVNKITNYQTTNKSDRNINKQFDLRQFNKKFEEEYPGDSINNPKDNNELIDEDDVVDKILPHQKPVQDILITIREMFYLVLEMLIDKKNPIPVLFSTPDRYFSAAIFLIVIGALLLLFSNLMISSDKNI